MLQERHKENILLDVTYQTLSVIASHMWWLVVHGTIAGRELKMSHTGSFSISIWRDPLFFQVFFQNVTGRTHISVTVHTYQNKTLSLSLFVRCYLINAV